MTRLWDCNKALIEDQWDPEPGVPKHCYQPGKEPFFLSIDNAPVHSFWEGDSDVGGDHVIDTGVSLLQLFAVSPKGHDQHQIIEHGIGVTKVGARKTLHKMVVEGDQVGVGHLFTAVVEGASAVDEQFVKANLVRLRNALECVSSEWGVPLNLKTWSGVVVRAKGTAGWYPPQTLC